MKHEAKFTHRLFLSLFFFQVDCFWFSGCPLLLPTYEKLRFPQWLLWKQNIETNWMFLMIWDYAYLPQHSALICLLTESKLIRLTRFEACSYQHYLQSCMNALLSTCTEINACNYNQTSLYIYNRRTHKFSDIIN